MNYNSLQKNTNIIYAVLFFVFAVALFSPHKVWGACQLATGQFRNFDYTVNFPLTWFANSVTQNENAQPFVYLDLKFNPDCAGNSSIVFSIQEHDSLDPNDLVMGPFNLPALGSGALEQTHIFTAGDTWCDSGDGGDCDYFLYLEIDDEEYSYSVGQVGQSSILNIEYDCEDDCEDQNWNYVGTVSANNTTGYSYGSFVSSNDPDFLAFDDEQSSLGTPDDEQSSLGTPDDEQSNIGLLTITEQIENPLGDGSTLPAFVESLLGIIIRAGIPLIVLAIIYTGFRFVYARGKPEEIKKAKEILLYTVIGTAIILGAWTIATILTNTVSDVIGSSIIHLA